jgi:hypothetical protein
LPAGCTDNPTVDALIAQARFTPAHADWLPIREQRLAASFGSQAISQKKRVLLLNATKGLQLYPSIVDFFALLQRTYTTVEVTSASYFDHEIYQFGEGVRRKGLRVVPVADVMSWTVAELNRFDVVLAIGPSEALAKLMTTRGLESRLVCLDLGFYHQLIESSQGAFLTGERVLSDRASTRGNATLCYSCQPQSKVADDLRRAGFARDAFTFRWFNYIPIGFAYGTYYQTDTHPFDIALLGTSSRDYAEMDPAFFRGRRILFVGDAERAPGLERLRATLDVEVVSRAEGDDYARLLALSRCVVLPLRRTGKVVDNVFLSVVDVLASGRVLVIPTHEGIARLEREDVPVVFCRGASSFWKIRPKSQSHDLSSTVAALLHEDDRLRDLGRRALLFARERLDIYVILERILREAVL